MKIFVGFLLICCAFYLLAACWPLVLVFLPLFIVWKIYETFYFESDRFLTIKNRIQSYITDCNDLNQHIEFLKGTKLISNRLDYGKAEFKDKSKWNVKRKALKNHKYAANVYNCSKSVCGNAREKPFEYICKYFGIKADEETLEKFESILNNFEAAEDGKILLQKERADIIQSIQEDIPMLIRMFSKKTLEQELGFEEIDFSTAYFPRYTFNYVSPGGNVSDTYNVVMNIENLNKFVVYLSEKIKFKKSIAGQRALMTSKLRERIKQRDMYTCMKCGISLEQEPHLLLEIDHIVPVSKGGLTAEENLQTLCWRCNRSKGAKV